MKFKISLAAMIPLLTLLFGFSAQAANWREWSITKSTWSATDERNYSEFVQALGESGCNTVDKCLKSPANFFATDVERAQVHWTGDCGRFPYVLRAYFAWKNHLPFGHVSDVTSIDGSGDLRYSPSGNAVTARASIIQTNNNSPIDGVRAVQQIVESVYTAMYRFSPETGVTSNNLFFDFYPVAITRDQVHPGTAIYDPNGHVVVVYKVEADGRVRFFDAHPDNTVSHGVYGEKFVRSSVGMGAGFKNFRPISLIDTTTGADGRLLRGRIVTPRNADIPGYSKEQFYGTDPDPKSWAKGKFIINGQTLEYYDFVRTRLAIGDLKYHPVEEMVNAMDALCQDLQDRVTAVDGAIKAGIQNKAQPANLPKNIYGTDGEWETFSTPSRDARLKTSFREVRDQVENFINMYRQGSPRIDYAGTDLIGDLRAAYQAKAASCTVTYVRSNGAPQTLTYDEAERRLFAMSFDPYHCVERRWGATTTEELSTCADGGTKQAWYFAEQNLRNQLNRAYDVRMGFDLGDLQSGALGSGVGQAPDVDLLGFLNRQ